MTVQELNLAQIERKLTAIRRVADRLDEDFTEDGCVYAGTVDTIHALIGELYEMVGRIPPSEDNTALVDGRRYHVITTEHRGDDSVNACLVPLAPKGS